MDQRNDNLSLEESRIDGSKGSRRQAGRWLSHILVIVLLIGSGVLVNRLLTSHKAPVENRKVTVPVPSVQIRTIHTGPHLVTIQGQGTVQPLSETQVVPQVSGKVTSVSPSLVNGGAVSQGEVLIRLDSEDYALEVTLAEARVRDAESNYALAMQESEAAVQEWRELYPETEVPELVARKPQLEAARAKLDADRADLRKAKLQLERTRLRAPFDAIVSAKTVDVGQYVSPGQVLAGLYGLQAAEIVVPLSPQDLYWFHVPGFTPGDGEGASARVRVEVAGREMDWPGRVVRAEGRVDEKTRMIRVVVRVEEPFSKRPPLVSGLFAIVEIRGETIENAALIPRSALRESDRVWVLDGQNRLGFRVVDVVRTSQDGVLVRSGIDDGDRVVTSAIRAVIEGMTVNPITPKET
jgi:RND family efflux transporter MFP subunit